MNVDGSLSRLITVDPGFFADVAQVLTLLGDPVVVLVLVVAVTWRQWMRMSVSMVGVFLVRLAYTVMKNLIGRARPDVAHQIVRADGYAMPSGHAAGIAFVAVLVAVFHPRLRVVAALSALVVGWTRVALGVHYPSDVVAGWLLGAVFGYACVLVSARLESNTIATS